MSRAESAGRGWWDALPRLDAQNRAFLPERTAAALRTAIASGAVAPGTRLPEVALTGALDVSRHTLRVAFALLEAEGLTRREPNAGVSVASPTLEDIRELYRVRLAVEPGVLQSFPFGAQDVAELGTIARAAPPTSTRALARANQDFHRRVVSQAGSPVLDATMDRVLAQMQLAFTGYGHPEFAEYRERHLAIVELLGAGHVAGAADALRVYLADSERMAVGILCPAPPAQQP